MPEQEVNTGCSVAGGNEHYSEEYPVYAVVNKPKKQAPAVVAPAEEYPVYAVVNKPKKQASFNKGERITATAL